MSPFLGQLNTGAVSFSLHGELRVPLRYDEWGYRDFFSAAGLPGCRPLAELPVRIGDGLVAGAGACLARAPDYVAERHWCMWQDGDGWLFAVGISRPEGPRLLCRASRALDAAVIQIDGDASDAPLRYPLDQILTWGLLSRHEGLVMHAAGVVRDGQGYVLAGHSGAGKSTLAGLCHEAGWRILNDDRVAVFFRDGQPRMAGTPWHGSGRFAEAGEVPLAGIFVLAHGESERLEPLSDHDARLGLLDVAAIPWFEDEWAQPALDTLERLIQGVGVEGGAVRRFHFTKSVAAVKALIATTQWSQ